MTKKKQTVDSESLPESSVTLRGPLHIPADDMHPFSFKLDGSPERRVKVSFATLEGRGYINSSVQDLVFLLEISPRLIELNEKRGLKVELLQGFSPIYDLSDLENEHCSRIKLVNVRVQEGKIMSDSQGHIEFEYASYIDSGNRKERRELVDRVKYEFAGLKDFLAGNPSMTEIDRKYPIRKRVES